MIEGIKPKDLIDFTETYLSTVRRFSALLPIERRNLLPDFWCNHYQILVTICLDGIAIDFRRRINRNRDSINVLRKKSLNNISQKLTGSQVLMPIDGKNGIVVKNLAIATESCMPFLKSGGTLWRIRDDFGLLRVTSGGDIFFENVGLFYLDGKGTPKQFTFKGMWIIANDLPSLFTPESAQKRGLQDFLGRLVTTGAIVGKKKERYTEFDMASELEAIEVKYLTLVNSEGVAEQELQNFLEEHGFIISPFYLEICPMTIAIRPQMQLPSIERKVDFVLVKELDLRNNKISSIAVEIKKPSDKLFAKNGELSEPLKVGLNQIEDIFEFISSHPKEAEKLLHVSQKSDLRAIVLIGRKKDLSIEDAKKLAKLNETNEFVKILLYAELHENIRIVSNMFGRKLRQPAVVVGQEGTNDEDFTGKTGDVIQKALDFLSKRIGSG